MSKGYGIIAYRQSLSVSMDDPSFYALIMAAMRKADDINIEKLKSVFPDVYSELYARYNAPGGCLDQDEMDWLLEVLNPGNVDEDVILTSEKEGENEQEPLQ